METVDASVNAVVNNDASACTCPAISDDEVYLVVELPIDTLLNDVDEDSKALKQAEAASVVEPTRPEVE